MRSWEAQKKWINEDHNYQCAVAKQQLEVCCKLLGLQEDIELLDVKDNDRFVLSYTQDPTKPEFSRNMIKLETLMRQTMGVVVDLRLESKEDKNKRAGRNGRE